jgi:hypothetical protein
MTTFLPSIFLVLAFIFHLSTFYFLLSSSVPSVFQSLQGRKITMSPTSTPGKRKKGAQPGNGNALRHGFYSRSFTRSDMSSLDSDVKGEFHDEINLARVNANRLAELLKDYKSMRIQDIIPLAQASIRGAP